MTSDDSSNELVLNALNVAFIHSRIPELMAVPEIARSDERAWVLAGHPGQLVNYASRSGPDQVVRGLWSRTTKDEHLKMLSGAVRVGNTELVEFLLSPAQKTGFSQETQLADPELNSSATEYARYISEHSLLYWAVQQEHLSMVRWLLARALWCTLDIFRALEMVARIGAAEICEVILSQQPDIPVSHAMRCAFKHRNVDVIFRLMPRCDKDDIAILTARAGLMPIWRALDFEQSYETLSGMARECITNGHARLLSKVWTRCMDVFGKAPKIDNRDEYLWNYERERPAYLANPMLVACSKGWLRVVKVLYNHGIDIHRDDLLAAASRGYGSVVEQIFAVRPEFENVSLIENAMKACARYEAQPQLHENHSNSQWFEDLFNRLANRLFKTGQFVDLQDVLINAMIGGAFTIVRQMLEDNFSTWIRDLRADGFALARMAKRQHQYDILRRLEELAGPYEEPQLYQPSPEEYDLEYGEDADYQR